MDKSKLKDITKSLTFLKDYSSMVVPMVIILVALIFMVLTPLSGKALKEQIETESIQRLGNNIRALQDSLVPTQQAEIEAKYQDAFAEDANKIALMAINTTKRDLLSYQIFPEPKDVSAFIFKDFGEGWRSAIINLITNANGRDCPTQTEIDNELKMAGSKSGSGQGRGAGNKKNELTTTVVDALCIAKANSASLYIAPENISGYMFWEKYEFTDKDKALADCWYWQIGYWIIEDVLDSAKSVNGNSQSVLTSPVKRILDISFDSETQKGRDSGNAASQKAPRYVTSPKVAMTSSCTGRTCNQDYDVVHFSVEVVISAKAIPIFMQALCSAKEHKFRGFHGELDENTYLHNQITILENSIQPVSTGKGQDLYRYGDDSVFKLSLICEYLLNKTGYEEIKPEKVKEFLLNPEGKKVEY